MIGKKVPHRPGGSDGRTQIARHVTQLYAPAYEKVSLQFSAVVSGRLLRKWRFFEGETARRDRIVTNAVNSAKGRCSARSHRQCVRIAL